MSTVNNLTHNYIRTSIGRHTQSFSPWTCRIMASNFLLFCWNVSCCLANSALASSAAAFSSARARLSSSSSARTRPIHSSFWCLWFFSMSSNSWRKTFQCLVMHIFNAWSHLQCLVTIQDSLHAYVPVAVSRTGQHEISSHSQKQLSQTPALQWP